MKEKYKFKGDFVLTDLTIESRSGVTQGLMYQYMEINIYESIFNNTMTGDVVMSDSLNLIEKLPIAGNEKITITFHTAGKSDDEFTKEFIIYKVSAPIRYKERNFMYRLSFCSSEAILDQTKSLNKFYTGTASDIVAELFKEFDTDSEIDIENTSGIHNIIVPNWTPIESINWLTRNSISLDSKKSGFLFFENQNGFNFKSVQSLYQTESDINYFQKTQKSDTINDYLQLEFKEPKGILSKLRDGVLSSRLDTYNLSNRELIVNEYDYTKDFDSVTSLDENFLPYDLEDELCDSFREVEFIQSNTYKSFNKDSSNHQKFRSITRQINNSGITILVAGNSAVTVGFKVDVNIPANEQIIKEPRYMEVYGGSMLIAEIKHTISKKGYFQTLTLLKDSYGKNDDSA